ncbi:MAG: MFS transporter [Pseudomonadota bacterium]
MSEAQPVRQFDLLRQRRFGALFCTQFLGAFNDNAFKSALSILFVYGGFVAADMQDVVVNLAAALFILPFFLFSALAGQLADKYPKELLIRRVKLAEIAIAVLGTVSVFSSNVYLMLTTLFLLGVQSTFFSPLKFAILPQHLLPQELIGGNAQIGMGTFVAILLGTILGGIIAGQPSAAPLLATLVVTVAIGGYLCSRFIPSAPPAGELKLNLNFFGETARLLKMANENYSVLLAIMGVSWFWLIGSVFLAQFPALSERSLAGDTTVVTLILATFTIAIALGSLACERLSGSQIEIGLVPLGALGIALAGVHMYFSVAEIEEYVALAGIERRDWLSFIGAPGSKTLLLDFLLIGMSGGLFIVPLQAYIQSNTPAGRRARIIAVNNIYNAIFMVAGSVFSIAALLLADTGVPGLLLIVIIMHMAVTLFIFHQIPEFVMRFVIWGLGHTLYRVTHKGLQHVPDEGGALIACNHVSYVDALLLAGAVRRPIRFIMHKPIFDLPILNFVFRTGKAIPIIARSDDEAAYEAAFEQIREALDDGDLLCIFPEGQLTKTGDMNEFQPGIEKIVDASPVPVVPMALSGLWGSWFSPAGGLFSGKMRPFSWIEVSAGAAIAPADLDRRSLRETVLHLRGERR